jgi:hypothetical protein
LYAAIYHPGGFYPKEQFLLDDNPTRPCFVDSLGERIDDDRVYFCGDDDFDEYEPFYVHASESGIIAIGSRIDGGVKNFKSALFGVSMIDEIPQWLHDHPVQRLLKLTMDSDGAKLFALSPRKFLGRKWGGDSETVFRPAFSDSITQTQLRQNTIAAYLLRNFVDGDDATIFEALKNDAVAKAAAAREVIEGELSKFQTAFDSRYGK